MRQKLFKSGHGSRINLINTQLELSRVQGAMAEARVSMDQARAAIQEAKNELVELEVTEPAQVLMTIVPLDEQVVVETEIEPQDIGHIAVGQEANVTVSGFDQRRYGNVKVTLTNISPTSFTDEKGRSYFKAGLNWRRTTSKRRTPSIRSSPA
jgi:multidrug resistance efflux pump